MKLNLISLLLALFLLGTLICGEEGLNTEQEINIEQEKVIDHAALTKEYSPYFHFLESFSDDSSKERWIKSSDAKFQGEWEFEESQEPCGIANDIGLVLQNEAKHHGISTKFENKFEASKEGLFFQYEVRFQEQVSCSGAYMKLLPDFEPINLNGDLHYVVMFGPDKCGETNKVHLIFKRFNPKTEEWEERALVKDSPAPIMDTSSHVYSFLVNTDGTFKVYVDLEVVAEGSIDEEFFDGWQPETIDDPEDEKPEDWIDEAKIPDPEVTKPEDWVDDEFIPNEEAEEPEDWDEDEDGEWERPMIANPEFTGKWNQPMIDNPEYKGEWTPKQIPNPDYYLDENPGVLNDIYGMGLELWIMSPKILFDNIILGKANIQEQAFEYAQKTWGKKFKFQEIEREKMEKERAAMLKGDFVERVRDFVLNALYTVQYLFQQYPIPSIATSTVLLLTTIWVLYKLFRKKPQAQTNTQTNTQNTEKISDSSDDDKETEKEKEKEEEEEVSINEDDDSDDNAGEDDDDDDEDDDEEDDDDDDDDDDDED
ncbi:calnexin 14d-related [Anaeramoeba flamelloides]|uniref:Calnexin 14d-related n=1 Tax=Anaeramoeba flamelloides TaxID=1746091 RepID=A0AAV7ZIG5_9EUKA|nr:calnexin 14d-related [Anaeramoeba flamelloides]